MSNVPQKTRKARRRESQEERRRQEEQRRISKTRRTLWVSIIVGLVVVVVTAIVVTNLVRNNTLANTQNTNASKATAANITSDNPNFPVVDGIACQANEQLAYHIHAHLSVYIDGSPVSMPANVGIDPNRSCIYWLHTHDSSGVIHVESPNANTYSLGTFFKMWGDYFSSLGYPSQLNAPDGWTVYVDGKPYTGDFHAIKLQRHELITMAYNSPGVTADTTYSWGSL